MNRQRQKAERLRDLHQGTSILVLPNAWDVASAVVFAEAGFEAVATTSAGVAAVFGYPDGQHIPRDTMLDMVRRIAKTVGVPVTADMEAGYGHSEAEMVALAEGLITAGAVGLNLEDAERERPPLLAVEAQVAKIRAILDTAAARGVPLVLNARTDVYLLEVGEESERFEETVRRINAYLEAGADCGFIPGVRDAATIGELVRAVNGPLSVLAGVCTASTKELQRLGVARVSVGSGPMRATMALTRRIASELREWGTYSSFTDEAVAYADANRMMGNEA